MTRRQYSQGYKDGSYDAWAKRGERSLSGKSDSYIDGYDKGFDDACDEMHENGLLDI